MEGLAAVECRTTVGQRDRAHPSTPAFSAITCRTGMKTILKKIAKGILRIVAPGAKPYLIAQRLEEMQRKLQKRVRLVALNTVSRLKGAPDGLPIPPGQLMFLVQGTANVREFLTDGRGTAQGILDVLHGSGIEIGSSMRILDFGCGCGRVIRHLRGM